MFRLTFLGTSSGVPTNRNVTALAVQPANGRDWWLVDCGEATQHRLQHVPLTVHQLAGICITHVHGDHSYGLPGLLASASMSGRTRPLILIAPRAVKAWLDATMLHTELFLPYPIVHVDVEEAQQVHHADGLTITRHHLSHRAPSVAFRFDLELERTRLDTAQLQQLGIPAGPDWGRLQAGHDIRTADGRDVTADSVRIHEVLHTALVVGGDNDNPGLLHEACQGAQLLVHEATYTEAVLQKVGPGPTHSSVQRVAQFAAEVAVPNLILTHFSPRYDTREGSKEIDAEARLHYHGNLFLARDFDHYEVSPDGVVRQERP